MKSSNNKTLSIKVASENANLTQENVAEKIGKCRSFVGLIETGLRKPSVATAIKMAKLLNVPPILIFPGLYGLSVGEKNGAGRARKYEDSTLRVAEFIKINEMAQIMQIKTEKARKLCGVKGFPAWKLDKEWRIHKKDMLKWLKNRTRWRLDNEEPPPRLLSGGRHPCSANNEDHRDSREAPLDQVGLREQGLFGI